jgi:hypothetical protein
LDLQLYAIWRLANIAGFIGSDGVFLGAPFQIQQNSDWDVLLDYLNDRPPRTVTQFYYYGHASPYGLGFDTPDFGLSYQRISDTLSNYYAVVSNGVYWAEFNTPFKFVFIDGCAAALGDAPSAFGISKTYVDYSGTGRNRRAFLGWTTTRTADQLWITDMGQFTEKFWERWTGNPDMALADAIIDAHEAVPSAPWGELVVYGSANLTWGE